MRHPAFPRLALLRALLFVFTTACDPPPPPGSESSSSSTGSTDAPACHDDGTSSTSSTGGPACVPQTLHRYSCLGWEAGLYRNGGAGAYQFFNLPGGFNAFVCSPQIVDLDSPHLPQSEVLAACRAECEAHPTGGWPDSAGTWLYSGQNVCVYASNGNNGSVPSSYGFGTPGSVPRTTAVNGCAGVWSVGGGFLEIPQVTYLGAIQICE